MKYRIYNTMWDYEVMTDDNNVVMSTNSYPNNREHWSIGWTITDLRKYYYHNEIKEIDKLIKVFIVLLNDLDIMKSKFPIKENPCPSCSGYGYHLIVDRWGSTINGCYTCLICHGSGVWKYYNINKFK